jgi:hypothetical protein
LINDRIDREAAAFTNPADPQAVLDVIKDTHEEVRSSVAGEVAQTPA